MSTEYNFKGAGSFGCVISPSLPCLNNNDSTKPKSKSSSKNSKNLVGKLFFDNKEYEAELDTMKKLKALSKVNKLNTYGVVKLVKNNCPVQPDYHVQRMCSQDNKFESSSDFQQIVYEDGGESMQHYTYFNFSQVYSIIMKMEDVFKFLKDLNIKNGLYHFDIALRNVLYNENTGEVFLIDFGLLGDESRIDEIGTYFDCPSEIDRDDIYYEEKKIEQWTNSKNMCSILFDNENQYHEKINEVYKMRDSYSKDYSKVDIFMLGVTISEICDKSFLLNYFKNDKNPYDFQDPLILFIDTLLKNTLDFNPEKRWSYDKILKHYKKFKNSKNNEKYRIYTDDRLSVIENEEFEYWNKNRERNIFSLFK